MTAAAALVAFSVSRLLVPLSNQGTADEEPLHPFIAATAPPSAAKMKRIVQTYVPGQIAVPGTRRHV